MRKEKKTAVASSASRTPNKRPKAFWGNLLESKDLDMLETEAIAIVNGMRYQLDDLVEVFRATTSNTDRDGHRLTLEQAVCSNHYNKEEREAISSFLSIVVRYGYLWRNNAEYLIQTQHRIDRCSR